MANGLEKGFRRFRKSQLVIPLFALALLALFNAIRDPSFFSFNITVNNEGNSVLSGNIISILNSASELAIISIGMTLVTACSRGQDISVGAVAAIAGSVFVRVLKEHTINWPIILLAFVCACMVAVLCGAFNGTLVAGFGIQPMIATLILLTAGRPIAYWINGGATPTVESPLLNKIGSFIPGVPIPTPILIVIVFAIFVSLVLRLTNLGLYTQAVGINEKSARLNGINAIGMKMLSFMLLGVCVSIAGTIGVSRMGLINHETLLLDIEMDAILAVAIGDNALSGGTFSITGSVLGAYIIQALTITLYAMKVPSTAVKAYKAVVIVAIVVLGSPVVQQYLRNIRQQIFPKIEKKSEVQTDGE